MTKKEMTEVFSVMMLAWPNAEIFKGGIQKLGPTINLWVTCLPEVDFWTGQQAVVKLVRECKFPPTVAEFREQVEAVNTEMKHQFNGLFQGIRGADFMYGSLDAYYRDLPCGCFAKAVIDRMGGLDKLVIVSEHNGKTSTMWDVRGIEEACRAEVYKQLAFVSGIPLSLDAPK